MACPSCMIRHLWQCVGMLCTLILDAMRWLRRCLRSPTALAAKNLFLGKQLTLYQEGQVKPGHTTNAAPFTLVWLAQWSARMSTMRTFAQQQKPTQKKPKSQSPARSGRPFSQQSREVSQILHLQRTIGNQAVQRLLQAKPDGLEAVSDATAPRYLEHDFSRIPVHASAKIQLKPAVNTLGDIYEQLVVFVREYSKDPLVRTIRGHTSLSASLFLSNWP